MREVLDRLPHDCSLDNVPCHLYVVSQIEQGLADSEAGKVLPHEQVAEELRRRWLLGAG